MYYSQRCKHCNHILLMVHSEWIQEGITKKFYYICITWGCAEFRQIKYFIQDYEDYKIDMR